MVTRNYYFFHLCCPYVKHFKKPHQKNPNMSKPHILASSWCQDISKNQQRMQNPIQNSLFVYSTLYFYKKTAFTAHTSSIRQLNLGISEDFWELNCLPAFIANLFKTVAVSLPWRILGSKQRDKELSLHPCGVWGLLSVTLFRPGQHMEDSPVLQPLIVKDGKEIFY